uniref:Calponin-homology (CH) domain-containing protein n=1 Tax=Sus scrofa TaxID=9823 RepID=A0A8D1YPW3_PIG
TPSAGPGRLAARRAQCSFGAAGGKRDPGTPARGSGRGGASGAGRLSAQARGQAPRAARGRRAQSSPGRGFGSSEFEPRSRSALVFAPPALGPPDASPRQLTAHSALPAAKMPVTEKDLAEDAPWKKIQQNTFTRWCNEHLKCVNKRIGNLQTDLSDGLRLIALLEVLSQKHMYRKYHQRP